VPGDSGARQVESRQVAGAFLRASGNFIKDIADIADARLQLFAAGAGANAGAAFFGRAFGAIDRCIAARMFKVDDADAPPVMPPPRPGLNNTTGTLPRPSGSRMRTGRSRLRAASCQTASQTGPAAATGADAKAADRAAKTAIANRINWRCLRTVGPPHGRALVPRMALPMLGRAVLRWREQRRMILRPVSSCACRARPSPPGRRWCRSCVRGCCS
jgi:hypothetical protein